MMNRLCYSSATLEDVSEIYEQAKALIDAYEDRTLIDYPRVLNWMQRKIEKNIAGYTCVRVDGYKVAYYRLCSENDRCELDDLYVFPAFRNKGIGTAILEKCLLDADKPIYLYVFTKNTGAISLYKRHGFSALEQVSPTRLIMTNQT